MKSHANARLFHPPLTATQAAIGVAHVHNIDKEGRASIAHTDISPAQFILIDGIYKLNDFNRAKFLLWSRKNMTVCDYHIGKNAGRNRSPEEYLHLPQSEKVRMSGGRYCLN
jgi:hypothetical protein